jgi:hypothetical protein
MLKPVLAIIVIGMSAGCHKESDSFTAVPSLPSSAPASTDAAPASLSGPQPSAGSDSGEMATTLAELTQALRKYSFEQQRLPKTFSEVVAAGYVKNMPQAPPGRKFEIDPKTVQVVLVKQ